MSGRIVLVAALVFWVPLLPIAWAQGYHTSQASLAFGLLVAVAWLGVVLARRVAPDDDTVATLVRAAVIGEAVIVCETVVLDRLHALSLRGYLVAAAVGAVAAYLIGRQRRSAPSVFTPIDPITVVSLAAITAVAALIVGFAATHAPRTLYDSQSYHLYFSARWLQDHALSILQTPFSDIAQAYAPANGEVVMLWLMAPWHGDFLARAAEFPFWLLSGAALYAIARQLGAKPAHAWYPAAFFLIARPVIEQAVGSDVDLILTALFASAIYLGLIAVERDTARDWAIWGVAVGLSLGTKYLALVYLPVVLSMAIARGIRWRALWAVPGILVFGVSWYLRNWIIAGSPIYPSSFGVLGVTLAKGAFTRAAMLQTIFHTADWHLLPWVLAHAFGITTAMVAWPLWAVAAVATMRRAWWPYRWLVLAPLVMTALFWFELPVNVDGRFLMPAVAPALVPLALLFGGRRSVNAVIHGLYLAAIAWVLIGWAYDPAPHVPWFMGDWFEFDGDISKTSQWLFVGLTAALIVMGLALRRTRWVLPAAALIVASTGTVLAFDEDTACLPARCDRLHVSDPFIRPGLTRTFRWVEENIHGANIAYTGVNLPYPIAGSHLLNRVLYVNIDGHADWRFHDYDRAYRAGRFDPVPPPLAISSGELVPLPPKTGPRDDAIRPRYERVEGVPALWLRNLRVLDVTYVFIARLSAYEIDYQEHDGAGFPVEDEWARASPETFTMVHADPDARVYAVTPGRTP